MNTLKPLTAAIILASASAVYAAENDTTRVNQKGDFNSVYVDQGGSENNILINQNV